MFDVFNLKILLFKIIYSTSEFVLQNKENKTDNYSFQIFTFLPLHLSLNRYRNLPAVEIE